MCPSVERFGDGPQKLDKIRSSGLKALLFLKSKGNLCIFPNLHASQNFSASCIKEMLFLLRAWWIVLQCRVP